MQLFLDLDGVLADFDRGHELVFGYRPDRKLGNHKWAEIRKTPGFFRELPPMKDMHQLWGFTQRHNPVILSGAATNMPLAYSDKHAWVRRHLGKSVPIIIVPSSEKCYFARPGDIIVDDWPKYRSLWEAKGGNWVHHTDAASSIARLREFGY